MWTHQRPRRWPSHFVGAGSAKHRSGTPVHRTSRLLVFFCASIFPSLQRRGFCRHPSPSSLPRAGSGPSLNRRSGLSPRGIETQTAFLGSMSIWTISWREGSISWGLSYSVRIPKPPLEAMKGPCPISTAGFPVNCPYISAMQAAACSYRARITLI